MSTRHCTVSGRVQGVGFRAWTEAEARKRDLSGWVRNRSDGTVEAVFSGEDEVVEAMVAALWTGPAGASVEGVDIEDTGEVSRDGFEVRPTE